MEMTWYKQPTGNSPSRRPLALPSASFSNNLASPTTATNNTINNNNNNNNNSSEHPSTPALSCSSGSDAAPPTGLFSSTHAHTIPPSQATTLFHHEPSYGARPSPSLTPGPPPKPTNTDRGIFSFNKGEPRNSVRTQGHPSLFENWFTSLGSQGSADARRGSQPFHSEFGTLPRGAASTGGGNGSGLFQSSALNQTANSNQGQGASAPAGSGAGSLFQSPHLPHAPLLWSEGQAQQQALEFVSLYGAQAQPQGLETTSEPNRQTHFQGLRNSSMHNAPTQLSDPGAVLGHLSYFPGLEGPSMASTPSRPPGFELPSMPDTPSRITEVGHSHQSTPYRPPGFEVPSMAGTSSHTPGLKNLRLDSDSMRPMPGMPPRPPAASLANVQAPRPTTPGARLGFTSGGRRATGDLQFITPVASGRVQTHLLSPPNSGPSSAPSSGSRNRQGQGQGHGNGTSRAGFHPMQAVAQTQAQTHPQHQQQTFYPTPPRDSDRDRLRSDSHDGGSGAALAVSPTRFSSQYHGMHTASNASADHLPPEKNCSLWLTNLPPGVTVRELLAAVRNVGRVWCTYINAADGVRHQTAAAKLVFFHPEAARRLREAASASSLDGRSGLRVGGYQVKVEHNRIKSGEHSCADGSSRVLIITGDPRFVNEAALTDYFRRKFVFELDEVRVLIVADFRAVVEYRFGSYRCQAQMGKMALEKDKPDGFEKVEFGHDPCEVGETQAAYGIAAERIQGRGL